MPQPPSPEPALPAAAADALAAVEQAGERAQMLADELAGGFDDIEALRASAPEGFDAGRDLDALLAAVADGAMAGGYELTHAEVVDEPPTEPERAPIPTPTPEPTPEPEAFMLQAAIPAAETPEDTADSLDALVAAAFLETEGDDSSDAAEEHDELGGAAFLDPEEAASLEANALDRVLGGDVPVQADAVEPEAQPEAAIDDAEAFAAALLEAHVEAAPAEVAAPAPAPDPAQAPVEAPAEQGPAQVNPERIQDAISAMEALLAQEDESENQADPDTPPESESQAAAEPEAEAAAAAAGTDGDGVSDEELAGLFAAPDVAAGAGTAAPDERALSDAVEGEGSAEDASTPPIHPDAAAVEAAAAAAAAALAAADAEALAAANALRMAFFPFGWMIALLAMINRPLERLSDEWRLAVSGVALAVAVPGALLLGYALFLK